MRSHSRSDVCLKMLSIVYLYALLLCCLLYVNHACVLHCYWYVHISFAVAQLTLKIKHLSAVLHKKVCKILGPPYDLLCYSLQHLAAMLLELFNLDLEKLLWCRINILERGFRRWSKGGRNTWNTCAEPTGTRTVLFCQSWGFAMCPSTKLLITRAKQPPRPNLRRITRARARRERWSFRGGEQICPSFGQI